MLLSRERAAIPHSPSGSQSQGDKNELEKPTVESFFAMRDYSGALTLLDFEARIRSSGEEKPEEQKWAALAHIRLMNYREAMQIYEKLTEKPDADPSLYCYLGIGFTHFRLNLFYIHLVNPLQLHVTSSSECTVKQKM